MKPCYKQTFDAVKLPPERQTEIRGLLSSRLAANQKEEHAVVQKWRQPRVLAVAMLAVLALVLVGFTFGSQILSLLGGGRIETGVAQDGTSYVTMDSGFATEPAEVRAGQIYFVLDGSNRNITDQCSAASYYQYDSTDAHGVRHVVLIGGTADAVGWAEFVWAENETFQGSNATYPGDSEPEWLRAGTEKLLNEPLK